MAVAVGIGVVFSWVGGDGPDIIAETGLIRPGGGARRSARPPPAWSDAARTSGAPPAVGAMDGEGTMPADMNRFVFLQRESLGNPVSAYLWAAATFLAVLWGVLIARRLILARLRRLAEKTQTDLDDFAVDMLEQIRAPEVYIVADLLQH